MSGANPVDTKAGANPAAALNPPAPGEAPAGGGLWAKVARFKTVGLAVGGAALVLGGGWYGLTHFAPAPATAVAQSEPAPAPDASPPPVKAEDPLKPAESNPDKGLDIKVPAVPVVSSDPSDIQVPKPPDSGFAVRAPVPDGNRKPAPKPGDDSPLLIASPPNPGDKPTDKPAAGIDLPADVAPPPVSMPDPDAKKSADPTKKPEADNQFKATGELTGTDRKTADGLRTGPAPRPGDGADKDELDPKPPVIRTGGMGDPTPPAIPGPPKDADVGPRTDKKADPPTPDLNLTIPGPPSEPMTEKKGTLPPLVISPKSDGDKPTATDKKDDIPTLVIPKVRTGPAAPEAKKDDPPGIPKIDPTAPDSVKPPTIPAAGPPPVVAGPAAAAAAPKKKDTYDEDWHTPRPGDTPTTLSLEYYHDARYAQALEAYNKDRRKAEEKFVRVPPPWVLDEQYPNLVPKGDKADRPGVEARPTGNIKFEPAAPVASSGRPAPPPAGGVTAAPSDEYRVLAKDGESIRDIAQKVMGDPNAWRKLWDLNPNVDPTQAIPAGTTLRVPR